MDKKKMKKVTFRFLGRKHVIDQDTTVLGRAHDCEVRIFGEPIYDHLSGHHCEVFTGFDGPLVRDMDSKKGTYINGERIEGCVSLRDGDQLSLGGIVLMDVSVKDKGWFGLSSLKSYFGRRR
ncbi:FHA domain-containing protein [Candidatus Pacearchaeota archaeon]|nr:FHA domain-containing protein [Candidatus Pacearchaeota archaeon]